MHLTYGLKLLLRLGNVGTFKKQRRVTGGEQQQQVRAKGGSQETPAVRKLEVEYRTFQSVCVCVNECGCIHIHVQVCIMWRIKLDKTMTSYKGKIYQYLTKYILCAKHCAVEVVSIVSVYLHNTHIQQTYLPIFQMRKLNFQIFK